MEVDRHYNIVVVGDINTMLLLISPTPEFFYNFKYFTSPWHQRTTHDILLLL